MNCQHSTLLEFIQNCKNQYLTNFVNKVTKFQKQMKQMNQSSISVGINLRNKGLRNTTGALIKGCVKDATTKLSIGSIPSNYEMIIYHSNSTKSFGTSQKRFYQQSKADLQKNDIPGQSTFTQSEPKKNASHSVKGYGPLIAKQQRNWIYKKQAPGPGKYDPSNSTQPNRKITKKRHNFIRQRKQKVGPASPQSKQTPGPGEYYVLQERNTNNGCKSSFKSKFNRSTYLQRLNTPGPGHYDVKLVRHPKSIIKETNKSDYKSPPNKIQHVFQQQKGDEVPGPGSYEYEMPSFKPLYERIKISGNFMVTKKDRFDNQIDKIGNQQHPGYTPNMYSYQAKSTFDSQQRLLKWPCFMSESKRTLFSGQKKLGPSFITPKMENRRNFHLNIKGEWF